MTKASSPERRLFEMWTGLRLFTLFWAILFSPVRMITERETLIPIWPPSEPYAGWLERVVFAPWERWDAKIFAEAVRSGFSAANGTSSFHPLFAVVSKPFAFIFSEPIVGLWLVSSFAGLVAVVATYRLACLDFPELTAEISGVMLLAFPVSAVLFAPYTESLWIAFAALCLLWARQGRWLLAAAAAAAATLTRQQGLFLVLPLAWELWAAHERRIRAIFQDGCGLLAIAAAPLAYLGWIVYRGVALGEGQPDFSSVHALIYSTLLASSSTNVVPVQTMLPPWEGLARAVVITIKHPKIYNTLNLILAGMFLLLLAGAWRYMRMSYRLLTAALVLVSFSYYTGPAIPYMGLPRHLLLAFPVFIGIAPVLAQGKRRVVAASIFLPLMLFVVILYVLEAWVP
jgi:hypothetical protein